ncbi:MAG: DNA mismatch repair protein MutS [Bacteroidetes bacterium]|nr:DNA mismatch repair protein MutS [Bacteroidota bacterium]
MCASPKNKTETPLMKQYYAIKAQYPGALLLFRVGDFYETFDEDARITSKVLGIVLTKRSNGAASDMDLAGFPHHSLDSYLPRLVKAGHRVAICDQLEDPKLTKTIVKRGVTELVTPGVSYNDKVLESRQSNYLASLWLGADKYGIAFLDISTGEFLATSGESDYIRKLLFGFHPAEVLYPKSQTAAMQALAGDTFFSQSLDEWVYQTDYAMEKLCRQFQTSSLRGYGIADMPEAILAAGAALQYLDHTQHTQTAHIHTLSRIDEDRYVWLDGFTIRNLELLSPVFPGGNSLLQVTDKTTTPMGARLLRNWLVLPLKDKNSIVERHAMVEYFTTNTAQLSRCTGIAERVGDLQRIVSKVALGRINPRELLQLGRSLSAVQELQQVLADSQNPALNHLLQLLNPCDAVTSAIQQQIAEDAPALLNKGGVFKNGVSEELDELRFIAFSGKDYLADLQRREAEKTGISSLKVGFNNVFGYYLEVTHAHKNKVPAEWIRKQTLTGAERYITPELKEYEEKILNAEDRMGAVEQRLWDDLMQVLAPWVAPIQMNATLVAQLDVLMGFAALALENNYCRPVMDESFDLDLKNCRHPVIEKQLPPNESYIPNDILLNGEEQRMIILTGPNMSGKSAVLRQTALCVILAQCGSFVPCSSARIGLVDKIYTRVGASDNISSGESTFMVEMIETASILNNLSNRSLILLDEIGRGTSTYDGVSLAWSIAEFLQGHSARPKTLFATHYHELNELESKLEGIRNYHIDIREQANNIVFLRKLKPGGSEHSFGIHVAQMAGIPNQVLLRASEILHNLESDRASISGRETLKKTTPSKVYQMSMFQTEDPSVQMAREMLQKTDINALTPIDALLKLQELKHRLLAPVPSEN